MFPFNSENGLRVNQSDKRQAKNLMDRMKFLKFKFASRSTALNKQESKEVFNLLNQTAKLCKKCGSMNAAFQLESIMENIMSTDFSGGLFDNVVSEKGVKSLPQKGSNEGLFGKVINKNNNTMGFRQNNGLMSFMHEKREKSVNSNGGGLMGKIRNKSVKTQKNNGLVGRMDFRENKGFLGIKNKKRKNTDTGLMGRLGVL